MQKVVLFDIDYTLFNPRHYREHLFTTLAQRLHYENPEEFVTKAEEVVIRARKVLPSFDPKTYTPILQEALQIKIPQTEMEKLMYDESLLAGARYEEVMKVFQKLTDCGIQIGIFSTGEMTFQKSKLKPFRKFITDQHVYIHANKQEILNELLQEYKKDKTYLVDDLLALLRDAKKINSHVLTIWIKRGRIAESTTLFSDFTPDLEVTRLTQIVDFIIN